MGSDAEGYKVTYRIKQEDKPLYKEIKQFVKDELHSDICFFQWTSLRSFYNAFKNGPNKEDKIEVKFLRQNVQVNIGCTMNYNRLKARRLPPKEPPIELRKDHLLPLLLEQWSTLSEAKKQFWRERLIESGISTESTETHPSVSDGKVQDPEISFVGLLRSIVQQLTALIKRGLRK